MKRFAVLIALDHYDDANVRRLSHAEADAECFIDVLVERFQLDRGTQIKYLNTSVHQPGRFAVRKNIRDALDYLKSQGQLDLAVFGFWGHGAQGEDKQRYLLAYDSDSADLRRSGISLKGVIEDLHQVDARETIVLLDCCQNAAFSGRSTDDTVSRLSPHEYHSINQAAREIFGDDEEDRKSIIVSACSSGQKAFELMGSGAGLFTKYLVDAIEAGAATVNEAVMMAQPKVLAYSKLHYKKGQLPCIVGIDERDPHVINIPNPSRAVGESEPEAGSKNHIADNRKPVGIEGEHELEEGPEGARPINKERWKRSGVWFVLLLLLLAVFLIAVGVYIVRYGGDLDPVKADLTDRSIASHEVRLEKAEMPEAGRDWTLKLPGSGGDLVLKWMKPGSFLMGSKDGETDEKPIHEVVISEGFWIGETEVTVGQWRSFIEATGYKTDAEKGHGVFVYENGNWLQQPRRFWGNVFADDETKPVVGISWNDAIAYCKWLSVRERAAGRLSKGYEYTLPGEAQWEYACRARSTGVFAGDLDAMAWYAVNAFETTHPVGTKLSNDWGVYDMHGNVLEWCLDQYGAYPGGNVIKTEETLSEETFVSRGGSWFNKEGACRSANRAWCERHLSYSNLGFRLVCSPVR